MPTLASLKWYVIAVMFAGLGMYASYQKSQATELRSSLAASESQKRIFENNLKQLQYLSNEQEKKLDASGLEIEALRKQFATTLDGMRKQVIPKKCEDAVKFAVKNRKELQW